ncbi:hypothetical protein M101_5070 [Bacteroides fragilis str. 1007-1-F |nr:hypothetical protein M101_5070 [Bacteroides fragilis str. 1007-1-F \
MLIYDNNHTNNTLIYCMYDFNHYICIIRNEIITIKYRKYEYYKLQER